MTLDQIEAALHARVAGFGELTARELKCYAAWLTAAEMEEASLGAGSNEFNAARFDRVGRALDLCRGLLQDLFPQEAPPRTKKEVLQSRAKAGGACLPKD